MFQRDILVVVIGIALAVYVPTNAHSPSFGPRRSIPVVRSPSLSPRRLTITPTPQYEPCLLELPDARAASLRKPQPEPATFRAAPHLPLRGRAAGLHVEPDPRRAPSMRRTSRTACNGCHTPRDVHRSSCGEGVVPTCQPSHNERGQSVPGRRSSVVVLRPSPPRCVQRVPPLLHFQHFSHLAHSNPFFQIKSPTCPVVRLCVPWEAGCPISDFCAST